MPLSQDAAAADKTAAEGAAGPPRTTLVESLLAQRADPAKPPNYLQVFLSFAVATRLFGDETPAAAALLAHMQATFGLAPLSVPNA